MKVKEAIELIKGIKHSGNGYGNSYISDFNKLKDIISLLQQGEKYKQMWEELERCTTSESLLHMNGEDFRNTREYIKQKYFPKEAK